MLEQFKVKKEESVIVREAPLRDTVTSIFEKMKVSRADAELAADVLVMADLRGVDSHGVSNMLRSYVDGYNDGRLNPNPNVRIVRETLAAATIDADGGLGIITAPKAMEVAIRKAKETGIGVVSVANGKHLGMASYHAMMALEHDMIGTCMTSAGAQVLPTFGAEPRLGTNPIAIVAPAKEEPPFVYDVATSVVAANKLGLARRMGVPLPGGFISDEEGTPIMEPTMLPEKYYLLPWGSNREMGSHKGYGLACVVEIFTSILSGFGYAIAARGRNQHFLAAYSIEAFTPVDEFKSAMDEFLRALKDTPPAPGHEKVIVPGEPEWEIEQERRANGIPLHKEVIEWFKGICGELSIPYQLEG